MRTLVRSQHAELLDLLEKNRLDEPATLELATSGDPYAALQRAISLIEDKRLREAFDTARRVAEDSTDATALTAAGIIAFAARRHHVALEWLREAAQADPRVAEAALSLAAEMATRLGWHAAARESRAIAAKLNPDPRAIARLADATLRVEERSAALKLARAASARAVKTPTDDATAAEVWLTRARCAAALPAEDGHRRDEVIASVARAADHGLDPEGTAVALVTLERVGAAPVAPDVLGPLTRLAEHALWDGDLKAAAAALSAEGDEATDDDGFNAVETVRLGLAVLQGDLDTALSQDVPPAHLSRESRATWYAWRAEALWRAERFREARAAAATAIESSARPHPVAWILDALAALDAGAPTRIPLDEVEDVLSAIAEASGTRLEGSPREQLVQALSALGGNRSTTPTILSDGALVALRPITGPRHEARRAQRRILHDPEGAADAVQAVVARWPESAAAYSVLAETHRWAGQSSDAVAAAEAALERDPNAPRALAVLALEALERDDVEHALALTASVSPTDARALVRARSRALLRAREMENAAEFIERAVATYPTDLVLTIGHALAAAYLDAPLSQLDAAHDVLLDGAPGLLSDAARREGISLFRHRDMYPDVPQLSRVLRRALQMIRVDLHGVGATYRSEGTTRSVRPLTACGTVLDDPHALDEDYLWRARDLLRRSVGLGEHPFPVHAGPPVRRPRDVRTVRSAPLVDPAFAPPTDWIEQFERDGFLKIEGAFTAEDAAGLRDRAWARSVALPDEYIAKYAYRRGQETPEDDAPIDLSSLDASDPSTWRFSRLDIAGRERTPYAKLSPRLWATIDALVGGATRLETRSHAFSEYFILNLALDGTVSGPMDAAAWHFDAPNPEARLDNIEPGLLLLLLFTDVEDNRGPTYIAPQSVGHAIRRIEEAGEAGLDLTDWDLAREIASECDWFVPLTGKAGDAYVTHPLMLHTPSRNDSGLIRWISNPVLFVDPPLDLTVEGTSPVERMARRFLRGGSA